MLSPVLTCVIMTNKLEWMFFRENETFLQSLDTRARDNGDLVECNIAKAVAMVCLFAASLALGTLPIKLNAWLKWDTDAKNNEYVKLLLCFGGGVLFCTTFMHMLPEVVEGIEELDLTVSTNYEINLAELLMCIGFFTMYFVEELVHKWLHNREDMKAVRKSILIRRGENDFIAELERKSTHKDHDHKNEHSHVIAIDSDTTVKTIRGLLIVLALSIHELFEGLAVGLEGSSTNVWYMFGAVSAHKFVIAFCIGVELMASQMTTTMVVVYVFTFAVVSPLGIGIGIAVNNIDHSSTETISVILQGLASGTLLYVVFFEILQADKKSGIKQFFSVFVGFIFMLMITILA
ncbi:unnamed protein product [Brassicogethes aeneus]|uniref:Uncharacterized protein n=1 Tax=Brassicogethes aeneus TaxID=1431903 RepID=A0A9P0AU08_BRAAE|nr:unnamed protein product [Brassicogethes aeneus]